MFFTVQMPRIRHFIYIVLAAVLLIGWFVMDTDHDESDFSERVKVSLRSAGDQLLRAESDSTSRVLPIIELDQSKYELSFERPLAFDPAKLVFVIDSSFQRLNLPKSYRVEVLQCKDTEVAYSYELDMGLEHTIVHCGGRILPPECYQVQVVFTQMETAFFNKNYLLYLLGLIVLTGIFDYTYFRKKRLAATTASNGTSVILGSYRFYPEQNKLVKEAVEIGLSKKECELLEIFVANPNQVIKRDELMKKVWEDNGVIVGRSLDTYISKLRKKLKDDDSIKLTNIHGVGYKLEVN